MSFQIETFFALFVNSKYCDVCNYVKHDCKFRYECSHCVGINAL